jgi:hypothetical protein
MIASAAKPIGLVFLFAVALSLSARAQAPAPNTTEWENETLKPVTWLYSASPEAPIRS